MFRLELNQNQELVQTAVCTTELEKMVADYLSANNHATKNQALQVLWAWLKANNITSLRAGDISLERDDISPYNYNLLEVDCYYMDGDLVIRHVAEYEEKKLGLWWNISLEEKEIEQD